jgi:uncharacterized protein (DUF4415 family)
MTARKRKDIPPITDEEEAEIQRQIAEDPDDWVSTDEELATARPFAEAFPELMESIRRSRGRPRVASPKQAVTLRLDPETLEKFKAEGSDWRSNMGKVLAEAKVTKKKAS